MYEEDLADRLRSRLQQDCLLGRDQRRSQVSSGDSQKIPEISPEITVLKARNEVLESKIKDLEENLRKAPDLSEFSRLQVRSEELEKHNSLRTDLEKVSQREEDPKGYV